MNRIAVKLSEPAVVEAVAAAEASLAEKAKRGEDLAERIGASLTSVVFRGGFSNKALELEIRPDVSRGDRGFSVTDPAWAYVDENWRVEPIPGPAGDIAREELEALQPPEVQAPDILAKSGLPGSVLLEGDRLIRTAWLIWDGTIYALLALDDDGASPVGGAWQEIDSAEVYRAEEALIEAVQRERVEQPAV